MDYKELSTREKEAYKAGYRDGKDDTLTMVCAALRLMHDHPEIDLDTPDGVERILDAAEHALLIRNPNVRRLKRPEPTAG